MQILQMQIPIIKDFSVVQQERLERHLHGRRSSEDRQQLQSKAIEDSIRQDFERGFTKLISFDLFLPQSNELSDKGYTVKTESSALCSSPPQYTHHIIYKNHPNPVYDFIGMYFA